MRQLVRYLVLFNVYINHSGSYWDNQVFDLSFWPCLEMTFSQRLQGSCMCHWDPMTAIIVVIWVTVYPRAGFYFYFIVLNLCQRADSKRHWYNKQSYLWDNINKEWHIMLLWGCPDSFLYYNYPAYSCILDITHFQVTSQKARVNILNLSSKWHYTYTKNRKKFTWTPIHKFKCYTMLYINIKWTCNVPRNTICSFFSQCIQVSNKCAQKQ